MNLDSDFEAKNNISKSFRLIDFKIMFSISCCISLTFFPFAVLANINIRKNATPDIVDLTAVSFDTNITQAPHFVLFFEPECPSCNNLLETWQQLASKNNGYKNRTVVIAKIDCIAQDFLCSRSDISVKKYPYSRLPGVANEEGVGIKQERNVNFEKCRQICDEEILCNSFAFCSLNECNLKDKIIFPRDTYTEHETCFTAYRTNETMARIYVPKGRKMTWKEINKEAQKDSYKLPTINDFETSGIMEGL